MKVHELKTVNPYFEKVWNGDKTFEVRKNDREFKEGDKVFLKEYDAENDSYSNRVVIGRILYILSDYPSIEKDHVVFSFSILKIFTEFKQSN